MWAAGCANPPRAGAADETFAWQFVRSGSRMNDVQTEWRERFLSSRIKGMPILNAKTLEFFSHSPEQTRRAGMRIGAMLQPGDLICLSGDLGAGKTTLVQGLAQGWGSLDAVSSPTFVLVNVYRRLDGAHLYHLDAYRLRNADDALDLDLDTLLETGALVVEWPERIVGALPQACLWVQMRYLDDEQRGMVFEPRGGRYERMVMELRRKTYGGLHDARDR